MIMFEKGTKPQSAAKTPSNRAESETGNMNSQFLNEPPNPKVMRDFETVL